MDNSIIEPEPSSNSWLRSIAKGIRYTFFFLFRLGLCFFIFSIYQVIFYKYFDPWTSPKIVSNYVENLIDGNGKGFPDYKWKNFDEISPYFYLAVMTSEDQKFLLHRGFDMEAMEKAWKNNQRGRRIKGGSTISQQVCKNMFLWPGKNLLRKALEAYYTLLIETFWSKKRILEVYANIVELGPNTYGAEMAARKYLKKNALELNRSEASLMAAVLPNPNRFLIEKPSPYVLRRRTWINNHIWHIGNKKMIENL